MWFVIAYLISFLAILSGIIYETRENNWRLPRYLAPFGFIALMPGLNTIVLAGLLIGWLIGKINELRRRKTHS